MNRTLYVLLMLFFVMGYILWIFKFSDHRSTLYERSLNRWISIMYWGNDNYFGSDDEDYETSYLDLYLSDNATKDLGKRTAADEKKWYLKLKHIDLDRCTFIAYNDEFMIAKAEHYDYTKDPYTTLSYIYYKVTPEYRNEDYKLIGYKIDTISADKYSNLLVERRDNTELYSKKIREMDYSLDHEDVISYDVKFIFAIILFFIFRAYYKKQ